MNDTQVYHWKQSWRTPEAIGTIIKTILKDKHFSLQMYVHSSSGLPHHLQVRTLQVRTSIWEHRHPQCSAAISVAMLLKLGWLTWLTVCPDWKIN